MTTKNETPVFQDMALTPELVRAIDDIGYIKPTHIQTQAIPLLISGHDMIGRSATGSGKTGAFSIPAIEGVDAMLERAQVLVLSPTRELAMQIYEEMRKFAKYKKGISLAVVYGGAPMGEQIKALRRAQIVIGTPGRLMDHMRRKTLKLHDIHTVILDEADEMLNMGFIDDIETILSQVPEERQTVLFSATMPKSLLKISNTFLTEPVTIDTLSDKESQADIEQTFYQVAQKKKKDVLSLLMYANEQRTIVFCNTKLMVDELAEMLRGQGFKASGLHGDMGQEARSQVMQGFRNGKIDTLIATDVAARGIDVDDVDVVINYDLPQSFEYYVHRIGRTGRAGKQGVSQTLICNGKQYATLRALMKHTGKPIEERKLPNSSEIMDKVIGRMGSDLCAHAKKRPGKAAAKLVEKLIDSDAFGGSSERVALILADVVMGGDERFDKLKNLEIKSQDLSSKKLASRDKKKRGREARRHSSQTHDNKKRGHEAKRHSSQAKPKKKARTRAH